MVQTNRGLLIITHFNVLMKVQMGGSGVGLCREIEDFSDFPQIARKVENFLESKG